MKESEYGYMGATWSTSLYVVPHKGGKLVVGIPMFKGGRLTNKRDMSKPHMNSAALPNITFRPATTTESISVLLYNYRQLASDYLRGNVWPEDFHIGLTIKTTKGIFVNPPANTYEEGTYGDDGTVDMFVLERHLSKAKEVNGIYLGDNDFGFAPYRSFDKGFQSVEKFAKGGLARVLEHASGDAEGIKETLNISSDHPTGVNVYYEVEHKRPILTSVMSSCLYFPNDHMKGLNIRWNDYGRQFGVMVEDVDPENFKNIPAIEHNRDNIHF
jgi:hypothetical protein